MQSKYRYEVLYKIAKEIMASLAPDEVLDTIIRSVTRAIGAKGCSLMLLTPDRKELIHNISYGLSKYYPKKGLVRADAIINEALSGKTVAIYH